MAFSTRAYSHDCFELDLKMNIEVDEDEGLEAEAQEAPTRTNEALKEGVLSLIHI